MHEPPDRVALEPMLEGEIMATELKLSVTCDRCRRVETRDTAPSGSTAKDPQFSATLLTSPGGKLHAFTFEDLCGPCENTVMNHLAAIEKKVEKKSPDRKGTKAAK